MRIYLLILLLIIGTNLYGQYAPMPHSIGQPATMLYVKAIKVAASTQALNVTRMVKADNLCLRLQADCRYGNVSYSRVWDSIAVILPVLGDTAHATALLMDMKRLTAGTATGTVTFFRDSIKSNGTTGYYNTGFTLPTGINHYHYAFWSNTNVGKPTGSPPFEMGGSIDGASAGLLASLAIRTSGGTASDVSCRLQLYRSTYAPLYNISNTTDAFWVNTFLAGTNGHVFMRNGVAVNTTTSTAISVTPGDLWIFRTGFTSGVAFSNKATRGVTAGRALTSLNAVSLTNAFINSK